MDGLDRRAIAHELTETRSRTLEVIGRVADDDLTRQLDPIVSPIQWDLPHIAEFESIWLENRLNPDAAPRPLSEDLDAQRLERFERARLHLPDRKACLRRLEESRRLTLARLETVDGDMRLVQDGFIYAMVANHERQHLENILAALQFVPERRFVPRRSDSLPGGPGVQPQGMVRVPGRTFRMGLHRRAGTYDNEWPEHAVVVEPFDIDVAPVTNGEFLRFVEDDGYTRTNVWPEDSWEFIGGIGIRHPGSWSPGTDGAWTVREFDRVRDLPLDEPVFQVSAHEAEAYARWAGKRLPTEAEWEKAARWDPRTDSTRLSPWGDSPWDPTRANLGPACYGMTPVGSFPGGVSPTGCHQMIGDMWEWTATEFDAYPGFQADPYDEYSIPFFRHGYRVLRGGSFATHPAVGRATFRNWAYPNLRHLFAGFRCARDV